MAAKGTSDIKRAKVANKKNLEIMDIKHIIKRGQFRTLSVRQTIPVNYGLTHATPNKDRYEYSYLSSPLESLALH